MNYFHKARNFAKRNLFIRPSFRLVFGLRELVIFLSKQVEYSTYRDDIDNFPLETFHSVISWVTIAEGLEFHLP